MKNDNKINKKLMLKREYEIIKFIKYIELG